MSGPFTKLDEIQFTDPGLIGEVSKRGLTNYCNY